MPVEKEETMPVIDSNSKEGLEPSDLVYLQQDSNLAVASGGFFQVVQPLGATNQ